MKGRIIRCSGINRLGAAMPMVTALAAVLLLSGCGGGTDSNRAAKVYEEFSGAAWHTEFHIKYALAEDKGDIETRRLNIERGVDSIFKAIEHSISPFDSRSLVARLNCNETDVEADVHLMAIFKMSQHINEISDGAFDPTLGPLINLWGFGTTGTTDSVPDDSAVKIALQSVGIQECRIVNGRIIKKSPSTEFNFSAIAKGYGVDVIAGYLRDNGATDYMVEVGGEISVAGENSRGEKWQIQIDAPMAGDSLGLHTSLQRIALSDCEVATSGNYRNYRTYSDGRTSGHTISAKTGYPVHSEVRSATVIAPTCMVADALATSCMAMPAAAALAMIEKTADAECLLVTSDTTLVSSHFPLQ